MLTGWTTTRLIAFVLKQKKKFRIAKGCSTESRVLSDNSLHTILMGLNLKACFLLRRQIAYLKSYPFLFAMQFKVIPILILVNLHLTLTGTISKIYIEQPATQRGKKTLHSVISYRSNLVLQSCTQSTGLCVWEPNRNFSLPCDQLF